MRIYRPTIVLARDRHPAIVVGEVQHIPFHSWTTRVGASGGVRHQMPPTVARAYGAKAAAMKLVDDRALEGIHVHPADIATAWEFAIDMFELGTLPLQSAFARENAAYWWRRAIVSSRLPARPKRRR